MHGGYINLGRYGRMSLGKYSLGTLSLCLSTSPMRYKAGIRVIACFLSKEGSTLVSRAFPKQINKRFSLVLGLANSVCVVPRVGLGIFYI